MYSVSPKTSTFNFFLNNSKKLTDFTDFWLVKSWENLTQKSYRLSTVRCSHCTLGNPKKSFSTVLFIHTSDYLRYLTRKQSVIHLPTPPENVTTLTCELQTFSSDWTFAAFFQTLEALKRASFWLSSVALKRTRCDVWQVHTPKGTSIGAAVMQNSRLFPADTLTQPLHRDAEKKNQFSFVYICYHTWQKLVNFFIYIKECISYNSVVFYFGMH